MLKKSKLTIIISSLIILTSLVLHSEDKFLSEAYKSSPLKNQNKNSAVYELQNAYHKIYNQYNDSIVSISTEKTVRMHSANPFLEDPFFRDFFGNRGGNAQKEKKHKQKGLGTGFIISRDGYVVTNHHVVDKADTVSVILGSVIYKAKIIGADSLTDIALIKIESDKAFIPVYFGNSDNVKIGDIVMAIGNPFGLDKTYTSGIVSATGRKTVDGYGMAHIQTDASINQGNSGGPLINLDGEVIGINRMIFSQTGGSLGIGFAVPINIAKETLIQLKQYGKVKRGYIGVIPAPLTEEAAKSLGLSNPEGVLLGSIEKDGPAEKAGLKVGDIIQNISDKKISTFQDLIGIVTATEIGKTLKITVWREKKNISFWVTVKERP